MEKLFNVLFFKVVTLKHCTMDRIHMLIKIWKLKWNIVTWFQIVKLKMQFGSDIHPTWRTVLMRGLTDSLSFSSLLEYCLHKWKVRFHCLYCIFISELTFEYCLFFHFHFNMVIELPYKAVKIQMQIGLLHFQCGKVLCYCGITFSISGLNDHFNRVTFRLS